MPDGRPERLVPHHRRPARAGHQEGREEGRRAAVRHRGRRGGRRHRSRASSAPRPGASTAVPIMLDVLERCFPDRIAGWTPDAPPHGARPTATSSPTTRRGPPRRSGRPPRPCASTRGTLPVAVASGSRGGASRSRLDVRSNMCSTLTMRWSEQATTATDSSALPGLAKLSNLVASVTTPEFAGVTFHEILAKSALNRVPGSDSALPFGWTINPYRGCSHACVYCFARPTHEYLDLDGGDDFDRQIVVKVNVAEVLSRELRRPSWQHHPVALGTNTDPYQRAEGKYRLMPGIIAALADSGTPFSILTKGTLLRRDLPLLVEAAQHVPVDIAMSIAIHDDDLQQSVEPGTPTTAARLATVRSATDAGLRCSVFMMPVLPWLTDDLDHLHRALAAVRASGATSLLYSALHLKPGVKEWWSAWLEREHPELVTAVPRHVRDEHLRAPRLPQVARGPHAAPPGRARARARHGRPGDGLDPLERPRRRGGGQGHAGLRRGRTAPVAHRARAAGRCTVLSATSLLTAAALVVPPSPRSGHSRPGGSAPSRGGDPR